MKRAPTEATPLHASANHRNVELLELIVMTLFTLRKKENKREMTLTS